MGSPEKFSKDTHSNNLWLKSLPKVEAREYLTQFQLLLKIKDDFCTENDLLLDELVKLVEEVAKMVGFEDEHVMKRLLALERDPILSTRVEQISTIAKKFVTAVDNVKEFSGRVDQLNERLRTEVEIYKELNSRSDLETLKKMSIEGVKVVVEEWNKVLQLIREKKAILDGLVAEWNQHNALQSHEECARMIDDLWVQNQFAIN